MSRYISINLSLSNFCNMGCSHCFLGEERKDKTALTYKEINETLTGLLNKGFTYINVNWGGGEIMALGKKFFKENIINAISFKERDKFYNKLYTMIPVSLDEEWLEIINNFDSIQVSIDKYHIMTGKGNYDALIDKLNQITIEKTVSYTPSHFDTKEDVESFFKFAKDSGVSVFHLGFYYPYGNKNPIPVERMIEIFEWCLEFEKKYGLTLGFFQNLDGDDYIENYTGWTAFHCFDSGFYITPKGQVTSCQIINGNYLDLGVPNITLKEFLEKDYLGIKDINKPFMKSFFFKNSDCLDCQFLPLCKGGCPYFTYLGNGKDIYCNYYKMVFSEMIKRYKEKVDATKD